MHRSRRPASPRTTSAVAGLGDGVSRPAADSAGSADAGRLRVRSRQLAERLSTRARDKARERVLALGGARRSDAISARTASDELRSSSAPSRGPGRLHRITCRRRPPAGAWPGRRARPRRPALAVPAEPEAAEPRAVEAELGGELGARRAGRPPPGRTRHRLGRLDLEAPVAPEPGGRRDELADDHVLLQARAGGRSCPRARRP